MRESVYLSLGSSVCTKRTHYPITKKITGASDLKGLLVLCCKKPWILKVLESTYTKKGLLLVIKRCSLHPYRNYHSDDDLSFGNHKRSPSDHQRNDHHDWIALPFHALDKPCVSWLSQIPSFRQETCQAYYRNDPVKYDLARWMVSCGL